MDIEALRIEIHDELDRLFDDYLARGGERSTAPPPPTTSDDPVVTQGGVVPNWSYTWPGGGTEPFDAVLWEVSTPHRSYHVRLAWGRRISWGKDRKRAIVFGQVGPNAFYPWTEFVETDTGQFAATIPNPERPRSVLTRSDPLPNRYRAAVVERTDQLFEQITNGPSLRLVLNSSDEEAMVRHGYWVARHRKRL